MVACPLCLLIMGRIFVVIIHFKFLLMLNDDVNDIRMFF